MPKIAFNPLVIVLALLMSWSQRGQQRLIDYLVAENRILRKKLGKRRVPLTDADRAILGRAGKAIGRKLLETYATVATPDTILRWHRKLVAMKWTFKGGDATDAPRPVGRPPTPDEIEQLVVKLARENAGWGYDRIVGALANLGHVIGETTVGEILGTTTNPNADFMAQVARNVAIEKSSLFDGVTHMVIDRDSKFSTRFEELMRDSGIELVKIPAGCPAANGVSERFVKSVKYECLRKLIFLGVGSLERALREYVEFHYRHERNHQGIGNRIIEPAAEVGVTTGRIERVDRLGGLLRYYRRVAA